VQQERKDYLRAKRIAGILGTLREGTVIVEGVHDIRTLKRLGIDALTYSQVCASALPDALAPVYILTDNDKGGEDKKRKLMALLLESDKPYVIDDALGKRLLKMTNSTSVEQVYGPIENAMGKTGG